MDQTFVTKELVSLLIGGIGGKDNGCASYTRVKSSG